MASVSPVEQEEPDESTIGLTLLTDLTAVLPADIVLDFDVEGFEVGDDDGAIGILVDNSLWGSFASSRCEVSGLEAGYHLLRAFLLEKDTGLCVKSTLAYVEAEFVVTAPAPVATRNFLFGQPSLCHILPRAVVSRADVSSGVVCDFFVHNCTVSEEAHGYAVRVYVEGKPVETLRKWTAFELKGVTPVDGQIAVRYVLVNPAGEEILMPPFNHQEQIVEVE